MPHLFLGSWNSTQRGLFPWPPMRRGEEEVGRPFHSFCHLPVNRGTGLLNFEQMAWPLLFLIFSPIFQMKRLKPREGKDLPQATQWLKKEQSIRCPCPQCSICCLSRRQEKAAGRVREERECPWVDVTTDHHLWRCFCMTGSIYGQCAWWLLPSPTLNFSHLNLYWPPFPIFISVEAIWVTVLCFFVCLFPQLS